MKFIKELRQVLISTLLMTLMVGLFVSFIFCISKISLKI